MNILNLSLDRSLVSNTRIGDSMERFIAYSQYCHKYIVIVPTTIKPAYLTKKYGSKIIVYAACGPNKYAAYYQIFRLSASISRQEKIDLITTNDFVTAVIAKLSTVGLATKVQLNVFGLPLVQRRWLFSKPIHLLMSLFQILAIYWSDSIRTDTTRDGQHLITYFRVNPSKIITLPVPPSPNIQKQLVSKSRQTKLRTQLTSGKDYLVLSVGTLNINKDFDNLIKATAIIVNQGVKIKVLIVGNGPQKEHLQKIIDQFSLADTITFYGSATYQQLIRLYHAADILVSSSLLEGLPRVLMEAALSGLPIVATNTSGTADLIVDHQSGLVVPIEDSQQLAAAINILIFNPQLADKFAVKAQQHALKYLNFNSNLKQLAHNWQQLSNQ